MIRINLLPYRAARKKENIRRQISLFVLSCILVFAALFFYNMSLQERIDALDTEIKNSKTMLAKFEKQAMEADRIKKELNKLEKKIDVIKSLETGRKAAVLMLDNMTKMVVQKTSISESDLSSNKDGEPVKRLWFTNFQAKGDNIDIKGIALDNKTVADFMTRLEVSKLYKNVNLKTIKQNKINKLNLKSFEITCNRVSLEKAKNTKKSSSIQGKK
jgi:type IV pilus assembly protein PilN